MSTYVEVTKGGEVQRMLRSFVVMVIVQPKNKNGGGLRTRLLLMTFFTPVNDKGRRKVHGSHTFSSSLSTFLNFVNI